jgi:zeta-carotene desaturase
MSAAAPANPDVIVVGAGVAGLAAAVALASDGARVTLLERRPFVGGRAYSYHHPALNENIDSQHVLLGCCTNLVQLIDQAGASDSIRWYDDLCFLEPNASGRTKQPARETWLRPGILPAPMHQAISFLRAPMLGLRDKACIATGLLHFLRGYPQSDAESFATWLERTGQTPRAIRHFWEPVVVGALNDTFANCSVKYAGKVFHESFLRSAEAGRLGIPARPLTEFFSPVAGLAQSLGVDLRLKSGVDALTRLPGGRWQLRTGNELLEAPSVVLSGDFRGTQTLVKSLAPVENSAAAAPAQNLSPETFVSAPITTIHLWYDQDIVGLDHAVLLDTRIQWVFTKSRIRRWQPAQGCYIELVISTSWPEIDMGRDEILASALRELALFFPKARTARLIKSAVLKEARATFSVLPGFDAHRPAQKTAWPGLFVAGDWTATEWPSTMEGAVRSGRLAAGEVVAHRDRFLAPEMPASGLMKWLGR